MTYQPIPDKTQVRSDLVGTQVARYHLHEKIGDGRNGAVYRARHLDTEREVAIKVTREAIGEREVRAASVIDHAGIARIYDFGRLLDGRHWIAMELMMGEGLDWALHRTGTMLVPEAVRVLFEISDALDVAHQRSLIHGYLRPSSVFLAKKDDGGFRVKLLDFGISPPEGSPEPSVDGDLHALGVLGFLMLTGLKEVPKVLPRPIAPVLPLVLEEFVANLTEAASKLRPRTAAEVRAKLQPLRPLPPPPDPALAQTMLPAPAKVKALPPAEKRSRRLPLLLAGGAVLITVAGVGAVVANSGGDEHPTVVAPPPPKPEPVAPVAVKAEDGPDPVRPKPQPSNPKPKPIPTEESLEDRIDRLEARVRKLPGDRGDALHSLNKLKLRLTGSPDETERKDVARLLDAWEKTHLGKSHWQ